MRVPRDSRAPGRPETFPFSIVLEHPLGTFHTPDSRELQVKEIPPASATGCDLPHPIPKVGKTKVTSSLVFGTTLDCRLYNHNRLTLLLYLWQQSLAINLN
jgi:hypothetical protein